MKHKFRAAVMRLAAVLLILNLFTICISSGIFARYSNSAKVNDASRVAKFTVSPGESFTTQAIVFENMAPGDSKSYSFTVISESEVAVKCMATLSTTGNLPLSFTLDGSGITSDTPVELGTFAANQGAVNFALTAAWPSFENDTKYLYEIDAVRLTVSAEQVD